MKIDPGLAIFAAAVMIILGMAMIEKTIKNLWFAVMDLQREIQNLGQKQEKISEKTLEKVIRWLALREMPRS